MSDNVGNIGFWKERIDNAERLGLLRLSVYATNKGNWDAINLTHRKVINKLFAPEDKVLDFGCGYGRASEWFDDEKYTGVDFSPDFIERAKTLYPKKNFICGDVKKMPFTDKEFDWAFCISVKGMVEREIGLQEWQDIKNEAMRVAKRVLVLEYSSPEMYYTYEKTP